MNNVYDQAHALARGLKECPEYQALMDAHKKVEADPKSKEIVKDLLKQQWELQMEQLSGRQPDTAKQDKLNKLYEVIQYNVAVKEYLAAQQRFGVLMEGVYKILGEAVADGLGLVGKDAQ